MATQLSSQKALNKSRWTGLEGPRSALYMNTAEIFLLRTGRLAFKLDSESPQIRPRPLSSPRPRNLPQHDQPEDPHDHHSSDGDTQDERKTPLNGEHDHHDENQHALAAGLIPYWPLHRLVLSNMDSASSRLSNVNTGRFLSDAVLFPTIQSFH